MSGKKKWWLILIPVILLAIVAAVVFWDTIVIYLAPKTVLSAALTDAAAKLESRSQGSPLRIIAAGYDPNGQNTTLLNLKTSDDLLGEITYDMQVQTDLNSNQIAAEGEITTGGNTLDISMYLDGDFAALTSGELLQGGYYGITYDTFSADIRAIPLLSFLISSDTIAQWETSIGNLQSYMNRSYTPPETPDISEEDVRLMILGILALKSNVSKEDAMIHGEALDCYKITYSAAGEQVGEILGYVLDSDSLDAGKITASFYLYEGILVKAELSGTAGEDDVHLTLILGKDAAADDLSLNAAKTERGASDSLELLVSTRQEGEHYGETISINDSVISYDWSEATGDMTLTLPEKEPIELNLTAAENGFCIVTEDFADLVGISSEKEYDCTMTVTKGAAITTPEYKNLDQWSFDDLLILLGGIGSLFGLKLQ